MKNKGIATPIIISIIMIAIMIGYLAICLLVPIGWVFKLIGLVIVAALVGTTIFVMVERIKEIRSGELDDLSKY